MGFDRAALGQRLHQLRQERGITQQELAEICGVTDSIVSRWERGVCGMSLDSADQVARALGVFLEWLVYGEDVPRPDGQEEALPVYVIPRDDGAARLADEVL